MPRVLHVGPCNARGGMATVMRTLAEHPPEGWSADLLPTFSEGGIWAKWRAYRRARMELKRRCTSQEVCPDIVHVHVASDWSWRRKSRLIRSVQKQRVALVVHLHSGRFETWIARGGERRAGHIRRLLSAPMTRAVVLSNAWKNRLESIIGPADVIGNPYLLSEFSGEVTREPFHLLLLARNDPIKGHDFAIKVAQKLRDEFPTLRLTMTGVTQSEHDWVEAKGWVSEEEKAALLARASVLLLPSAFEGQPVVALEALAAGLSVCVSDRVMGLPDTVMHATWGDVHAWVSMLGAMLSNPREEDILRSSIDEHAIDHVQQRWKSVYDSLLV